MLVRALTLLMALALGGCSMTEILPDWSSQDLAGPEPVASLDISNKIANTVGTSDRRGSMEVSAPRRSDSDKGPSWLYCVKVAAGGWGLPRYYAVFMQREKVVQSRLSVLIDQCEMQSFVTLNWTREADKQSQEPIQLR